MEIDYTSLGQRLARIRKQKKFTQERLAERTNLANNYISNIETGRSIPSLETLVKLCEALEVTPNDLLLGTVRTADSYLLPEIAFQLDRCTSKEKRLICRFVSLLLEEREKSTP